MRRVRVGLIGLGSMFLLVMLSAALLRVAAQDPKAGNIAAASDHASGATPNEPLAQLGVAPGNPQPDNAATARVAPPGAATTRTTRR